MVQNEFSLNQNYPNPFNPFTNIKFVVPEQSKIKLSVFDILGREISVITNGTYSTGIYSLQWNGSKFSSGIYFLKMSAQSIISEKKFDETKKIILMKLNG